MIEVPCPTILAQWRCSSEAGKMNAPRSTGWDRSAARHFGGSQGSGRRPPVSSLGGIAEAGWNGFLQRGIVSVPRKLGVLCGAIKP